MTEDMEEDVVGVMTIQQHKPRKDYWRLRIVQMRCRKTWYVRMRHALSMCMCMHACCSYKFFFISELFSNDHSNRVKHAQT